MVLMGMLGKNLFKNEEYYESACYAVYYFIDEVVGDLMGVLGVVLRGALKMESRFLLPVMLIVESVVG